MVVVIFLKPYFLNFFSQSGEKDYAYFFNHLGVELLFFRIIIPASDVGSQNQEMGFCFGQVLKNGMRNHVMAE